jgi:hypothetical protein
MIYAMNDLGFVASMIGSLAIPVTVVATLLIFRRPVTDLLGRIISYEGLGQKVDFGQKLAGAEESVSKAEAQAQGTAEPIVEPALRQIISTGQGLQDIDLQNVGLVQLAEMAASNPSFVVIKAWEDFAADLTTMVKTILPDAEVRNPIYWLPELAKDGRIGESFPSAVLELLELRNNVAHGQHNPTAGEAVTYVESIRRLATVAARAAGYAAGRRAGQQEREKRRTQQDRESPD